MTPPSSIREFARSKVESLLKEMVLAVETAARRPDAEAVHKMRVSIRRFQQAMRLFRQYLDRSGVDGVKSELRAIMEAAGELRNRDIAMKLVADDRAEMGLLESERQHWNDQLAETLRDFDYPDLSQRWHEQIGLDRL